MSRRKIIKYENRIYVALPYSDNEGRDRVVIFTPEEWNRSQRRAVRMGQTMRLDEVVEK